MLPLYEAGAIQVAWAGLDLSSGWADDTFLEIEPIADIYAEAFGANGQMGMSKLANQGALITMTFKQTAPVRKEIARIAAAQQLIGAKMEVALFKVIDPTGDSIDFYANNAILKSKPTNTFGAEMGEVSYTWVCEQYISSDNPAEIAEGIKRFVSYL